MERKEKIFRAAYIAAIFIAIIAYYIVSAPSAVSIRIPL